MIEQALDRWIRRPYGTHRGLVRLALDQGKLRTGRYRAYESVSWEAVRRFVFVCQGNICRSPYAEAVARAHGLPAASFGYATTTGLAANDRAQKIARERGISLHGHVTTDMSDFQAVPGDLLLVMEDRHLSRVQALVAAHSLQLSLLGLWAHPARPLIYDPHHLSEDYFHTCYRAIDAAVDTSAGRWTSAREAQLQLSSSST